MKKLLLFSSCVAFALSVQAQSNRIFKLTNTKDYLTKEKKAVESAGAVRQGSPYLRPVHTHAQLLRTNAVTPVSAKNASGNSANIFGSIVTESNNLTANQDLGVTLFTHRACSEYVAATTAQTGDLNLTWATDCVNWDSTHVPSAAGSLAAGVNCRYPTGGLYNPPGNTVIGNAIGFGSGPYHIGGTWTGSYFSSGKLDGTGDNFQAVPGLTYAFARLGSYVTSNGNYYALGNSYDDQNAPTVILGFPINRAAYDGGTNTFTVTQSVISNAGQDEGDDGMIAFSEDGSVGYFSVTARDTSGAYPNYVSRMPIIWKTTDGGTTWNHEPVVDFGKACGMSAILGNDTLPDGTTRPFFVAGDGYDMTVDKNGRLHIVTTVLAAADDADMVYSTQHIVDVYGSGTEWAAAQVGILATTAVGDDISPWVNAGTGVGWDGRIQVGRTQDGSRIFYGWIDSDPSIAAENLFPDIHVSAMNADTYQTADNTNVTAGTAFAENNLWMYLSSVILNNSGTYSIPMVTTDSRDPNAPGEGIVQHYSVCGVTMTDADINVNTNPAPCLTTGIAENNAIKGISISQNYPNPFNGSTAIDVKVATPVVISMEVTNYLGQVVKTMDAKNYAAGAHKIEINASDLNAGVYFYTIKVGNEQATGKMIVQ